MRVQHECVDCGGGLHNLCSLPSGTRRTRIGDAASASERRTTETPRKQVADGDQTQTITTTQTITLTLIITLTIPPNPNPCQRPTCHDTPQPDPPRPAAARQARPPDAKQGSPPKSCKPARPCQCPDTPPPSVCPSVCLSTWLSVCLPVCLSVCRSVCRSVSSAGLSCACVKRDRSLLPTRRLSHRGLVNWTFSALTATTQTQQHSDCHHRGHGSSQRRSSCWRVGRARQRLAHSLGYKRLQTTATHLATWVLPM